MTNQQGFRSKETGSVFKASSNPFFVPFFTALEANTHAFAPLKELARAQLEMASFINRRAQACLEMPSRLAQCRGPHDILQEQMRFWSVAAEDYSVSSQRLAEVWGQSAVPVDVPVTEAEPVHDYIAFPVAKRRLLAAQDPATSTREFA